MLKNLYEKPPGPALATLEDLIEVAELTDCRCEHQIFCDRCMLIADFKSRLP